jgi:hypothetical protein
MSELVDRIRKRLKELDVGEVEAATSVEGLERNFIRDLLSGKKQSFSAAKAPLVAQALQWTEAELRGESAAKSHRGPLIASFDPDDDDRESLAPPSTGSVSTIAPYQGTLPNAIPDLEAHGGAGSGDVSRTVATANERGVTYSADAVRGEIVLPQYLLNEYTRTAASRIHSIRVRGDSMETTLTSGDRVFADTNDTAIGQGGIFVILDHRFEEVLVKRLKRIGRGEKLLIRSDNPKQGDDEVASNEITIIGRAVARLTRI